MRGACMCHIFFIKHCKSALKIYHRFRSSMSNKADLLKYFVHAILYTHNSYLVCLTANRYGLLCHAITFCAEYVRQRGEGSQETLYNTARLAHQCGMLNIALHFYQKALKVRYLQFFFNSHDGNT